MRCYFAVLIGCVGMVLAGCATVPVPESEEFFEPVTLEQRQNQTRSYEHTDDIRVLQAGIALLLDNGFQINQAENRLGWVHAYKVIHWKYGPDDIIPAWIGVLFATVVTHDNVDRGAGTQVRVTFHGADYSDPKLIGAFHLLDNAKIYQEFFSRLSKALFLEGGRI